MRSLGLVAFFGLAVGCTAPAPPRLVQQAILQGTPDPDGDPSVVFLNIKSAGGDGFCTGSVIAPHVVLTAAHCVNPSEFGGAITGVRAYFGTVQGLASLMDLPHWVTAREWHYNPDFNLDGNLLHDNGVVVFDEVLPSPPLPILLAEPADQARGQTIRLVGFGIHRIGDQLSIGSRYETTAVISGFGAQLVDYQGNAHSICSGDSGGPSFLSIGGVETIIGVHSYTLQDCIGFAHDSRVDSNLYWSAPLIELADPGYLPPGTGIIPDMADTSDMSRPMPRPPGCAMGGAGVGPGMLAILLGLIGAFALRRRSS
jgi:hypothetical protein